jgi:pentatricopeptide repeat protein
MVESGFSTKLGAAEDMVLGYCKHRDVAGAIEFVGSLPVYNRDYQLYANIIECAIMEGNIDPILPLYKELVTNGIKMEDFLLSRVVGALLRRDRYKDLLSIIPDVQDVSSIELELSACFQKWFREGKIDQAVQVFKYLNYRSTTLYNCMIEQFFKVNNPTRALELIIQMGEENVAGDENTFNIVLQYDPKMANVDALLDEMYSRGYHIHSVSGAQQMITLFGQKRYKDAEKIFTFMKVRDSTVYRAMLNYYIENHDIRDIERIFGLMQMEGVPIGLEYFIKMQKFKTKKTFFNKMVELYGTAWKRRITLDNTSRVVKEEVSVIDSKA